LTVKVEVPGFVPVNTLYKLLTYLISTVEYTNTINLKAKA